MSKIMQQMKLVNEVGLRDESVQIDESKKGVVSDSNSMTNHIMAYQNMISGKKDDGCPAKERQVVNEGAENLKVVGALQVVKEILSSDFTQQPLEEMKKIKRILNDF